MPDKQRTKREIFDALVSLTKERSIDSVAVKEICEAAQISRQTFYTHFSDKYDVAVWHVFQIVREIFAQLGASLGWREAYRQTFKTFESNPNEMIGLLKTTDYNSVFNSTVRSSREDFTNAYIRRYDKAPEGLIAYQIERFSLTASQASNDWIAAACQPPADVFLNYFLTLIPSDLFTALDVPDS